MTQQFLNESTIEDAFAAYLKRWHLPSVQTAWQDKAGRVRKPSLAQFTKRFGEDYERRQRWLAKRDGSQNGTQLAVAERDDVRQTVAEAVAAALSALGVTESEEVILGSEDVEIRNGVPSPKPVKAEAEEPKFVKPENFNELPRSGQVYFILHRALEAGQEYAVVPVKRGIIAECISQIKDDGRDYLAVAGDLVSAS